MQTTTTVTMYKSSVIKMIQNAGFEIKNFYFNGQEFTARVDLIKEIQSWPGSEYDWRIEEGETAVIDSWVVLEAVCTIRDNRAYTLDFSYAEPGATMPDYVELEYKKILPIAVMLGLIDDYTFDYDIEVVVNIEQDGYISAPTGEWKELPDIRRRMEFNDWLNSLDLAELEAIAYQYITMSLIQ